MTPEDEIRDVLMDAGRAELVPALFRLIDAAQKGQLAEVSGAMRERHLVSQIESLAESNAVGWSARLELGRCKRNHRNSVAYFLGRIASLMPAPKRDAP